MSARGAGGMVVSGRLSVSPQAAELMARQSRGRALAIEFRELDQSGCCSSGAVVKLNWRDISSVHADPNLVSAGDIGGVPILFHHVIGQFLKQHPLEVVCRSLGPFHWLALRSDRDPAMWSILGDGMFGD